MSTTLDRIQVAQGLEADLPTLMTGEFGFTTDTTKLFIGNSTPGGLRVALYSDVGTGTVKATAGALTNNALMLGAGTIESKVAAGFTTDGVSKLILGVAGSSVGSIDFKNATSGTINIAPPTGALGTLALVLPITSGTFAITANKLSVFAATTSAELASVISDETGTGVLVFGTSPTFTTDLTTPKVIWTTSVFDSSGSGTPEGVVTANIGSTFRRTNGGASTTFYVKETGTGNTGWVAHGAAGSGSGTVNSGTINYLAYYAATGTAVSGLATANSGVLITSSSGVPSISTNLPNGLTILSASGTALLYLDAPTGSPTVAIFKINGSQKGVVGVAGASNNYITGAVAGDLVISALSGHVLFSRDNGTSLNASITDAGFFVKSIATTCQIIGNSPTGSGSIAQFQINGTGKLFVGAAGVANNYVTGAATDDAFVRVDNGDFLISTSGSGSNIAVRVTKTTGALLALRPTAGIGYGTGAGGTVTQATSKSTGVTLNNVCGAITMNNASLGAVTAVTFTLTNSAIAATDIIAVKIKSGATAGSYLVSVDSISAGSCTITLYNYSIGALAETVVISFAVIKAVTS